MEIDIERNIVLSIIKGDEKAFEKLFYKYFPKVKFFISGILRDNEVAEDLAQDLFLKLWNYRQSLIIVDNINAYIYKSAKNLALEYIRRQLLFEEYENNCLKVTTENTIVETDSEENLYASELDVLIQSIVAKMPEQRRRVFKMSRYEGVSNDEISQALSISKRTVENHLTTALSEIKKMLDHINFCFLLF